MGESSHSRHSSPSSASKSDSHDENSPKPSESAGPTACPTTKKPQRTSKSDPEHRSLERRASQQHEHEQKHQGHREVDIHCDGRFMSSLRAIHASDQSEAPASKRRTGATTDSIAENGLGKNAETPRPGMKSPSPVRRPRRMLQRSRAFSVDRSPSPSGRVCEIDAGGDVGEDELCALFQTIDRGS